MERIFRKNVKFWVPTWPQDGTKMASFSYIFLIFFESRPKSSWKPGFWASKTDFGSILTDFCLIFEGFFVIFDAFLGDFFNAKIERNYFFAILFCSGYCQCFFVHALSRGGIRVSVTRSAAAARRMRQLAIPACQTSVDIRISNLMPTSQPGMYLAS